MYLIACHRALKNSPHWLDSDAALAVLVISYQNLADLYLRQSNHNDMLVVYRYLLKILQGFNHSHRLDTHDTCLRIGTELTAKFKDIKYKSTEAVKTFDDIINEYFNPTNYLIKDHN